jgi:DNA replication protein DnaC
MDTQRIQLAKEYQPIFIENNFPKRIAQILLKEKFEPLINLPQSSYLYGKVRIGKSTLAAWWMAEWMRIQYQNRNSYIDCEFTNVTDLLLLLRSSFKSSTMSELDILNKYKKLRFLVLDDMGVEKNSDWTFQALYSIISYRYDNMLPTIYTSNLDLTELADKLQDDRITSRIAHDCKDNIILLNNKPYI